MMNYIKALFAFTVLAVSFIYSNMGNTISNKHEPCYIGTWKSDMYGNIKGVIKIPQLIINKPDKTTASVTYDDSSEFRAGVTLEMAVESYYRNNILIYTSTISNGFLLNQLWGPQTVTYTPTARSTSQIVGTYKSVRPDDHGTFTLTL